MFVLILASCSKNIEPGQYTYSPVNQTELSQAKASELLLHYLEPYEYTRYSDLVEEIGSGDSYNIITELPDGSNKSYTIVTSIDWENENRNSLLIKAALYGSDRVSSNLNLPIRVETIVVRELCCV